MPKSSREPWESLGAILDPKAPFALRLRGLRLYAGFLLVLQGGVLLLLAGVLPKAAHPFLWVLALGGSAWLLSQAEAVLRAKEPLAPLLVVGLGAGIFFFLGVMGLLLRPWGLVSLLVGAMGFAYLWHRSVEVLAGREEA